MASTSSAASTPRSSSPPPSPPLESPLCDPFDLIKPLPRNDLEERINKRRRIEQDQDSSLIHGFELQQHAARLLESNDHSSLQEAIDEYSQTKNESLMKIFKSFSHHYPNSFSLKLAKILEQQPPLQIRNEAVTLLLITLPSGINCSMNLSILTELKNPLLHSLMVESEEIMFSTLCETVGLLADRLYQFSLRSWDELLQCVCDWISGDAESNKKKGLLLLPELSENVVRNKEFWLNNGNFDIVFGNIVEFLDSMDQELKTLAYNASIYLMSLAEYLKRTEVSDFLLPILLNIIDQHEEEEVLLDRVQHLWDLATMDDGNSFKGKHGDVFWCMIRVAEIEDANEELRFAAVNLIRELDGINLNVMENLIRNISQEEMRRVVVVGMNMVSCVIDDPIWSDVDNKDFINAGMTDSFALGIFLFNSLALDANETVFVPTAIEMMTNQYATHVDWRFRFAAMLVIGWIAEKNSKEEIMDYFHQILTLVLKSLDDLNSRVLWATMLIIMCLSEYKELVWFQYHKKLLAKLVPIIRCNSCARVQLYAVIAIRRLVETCGLDKISPFGETIVPSLLEFLKHEKQKLQVEAIDILKYFADSMPGNFRKHYYNRTMEALKVTVFDEYSSPRLLIFAKCLEFMVCLVTNVRPDNLKEQEAVQVMESLISLEGKLSNTENLTKCLILKALDQICRCPKLSIDKFIDKIMSMLLGSAQPYLDQLTVNKLKDDDEKRLVETMIVQACHTMSYCAVRSSVNFSPYHEKVATMFMGLHGSSNIQIRMASVLGLPNLLLSVKVSDQKNYAKICSTFFIVKFLIEVSQKETDWVHYSLILRSLARCIQTCSSFFSAQSINIIAEEIKDTIRKFIKIEIVQAQEVGTMESSCVSLPPEDTLQEVVQLIATAVDKFKNQFKLHVDDLMSNVVVFLAHSNPDRLIAFAISIFNIIFQLFPDKLPPYHDRYILASCFALRREYPCSELHAARAIGICAMYGGDQFKASGVEGILRLYNVMRKRIPISDTAVAALGKICEFHRDSISPKVVQKWLNFLPLKDDFSEARYAHGLLSKLIQSSDEQLFGSNNKNLHKIISVVKEILSGPDRLGTEEAIKQMIDFIDQHGGMEIITEEASSIISS